MCTGFVQNFPALVGTRILLGFFEGCLFPSMTLLLANYYLREEVASRIAYLFSTYFNPGLSIAAANTTQSLLLCRVLSVDSSPMACFTWTVSQVFPDGDGTFRDFSASLH